jgi:hypothetical protein
MVGSPSEQDSGVPPLAGRVLQFVAALVLRALIGAPRRQFDLPRWTGGREFGGLHATSVAWLDGHFEVIERGAPWLHRVGTDVWDFCKGGVSNPFLRFTSGFSATAGCVREVTAVYGFDGPLTARLRSLDQALPAGGWEMTGLALRQTWQDLDADRAAAAQGLTMHRTRWMTDRRVNLGWRPTAALGYPPGGQGTPPWGQPPLTPRMRVTCSSRGQETGWGRDPNKARDTSRNYLALEASETGVPELLEEALAGHEHALTVTIHLAYYSNPDARARPHRIPRHLFPTQPGPPG